MRLLRPRQAAPACVATAGPPLGGQGPRGPSSSPDRLHGPFTCTGWSPDTCFVLTAGLGPAHDRCRGARMGENGSPAVTWQVAQPLWARPPPGLLRGGSTCGLARCLANADLLSLRSTKPSTAPCPLHSWPTAPCSPRVSLGPLTIRAHSLGQLRPAGAGGCGEHPGSQRGLTLPRPQPPEGPCVVSTSPYAFKPRTEMWGGLLGCQLQRPR